MQGVLVYYLYLLYTLHMYVHLPHAHAPYLHNNLLRTDSISKLVLNLAVLGMRSGDKKYGVTPKVGPELRELQSL